MTTAMENPQLSYNVNDLDTKEVILYPYTAQVSRVLKDVPLLSGINEIEIIGVTPTALEQSLKVEGTGRAVIADMSVEMVNNPVDFEDVFPESDVEFSGSNSEPEDDHPLAIEIRQLEAKEKEMTIRLKQIDDSNKSADRRTKFLNNYCDGIHPKDVDPKNVGGILDIYAKHVAELQLEMDNNQQERIALGGEHRKLDVKLRKARLRLDKLRQGERRKETRKELAKQKLREQRLTFWPKKVYRVLLTLEVNIDTPTTSRRSSIGGDTIVPEAPEPSAKVDSPMTADFVLTYVTREASWKPKYDISLSTIKRTGSIIYRAELINKTSETWTDAKISLSTSQASFGGLSEKTPHVDPWYLQLVSLRQINQYENILKSAAEKKWAHMSVMKQAPGEFNRDEVFGETPEAAARSRNAAPAFSMQQQQQSDDDMGFGLFDEPPGDVTRRYTDTNPTAQGHAPAAPRPFLASRAARRSSNINVSSFGGAAALPPPPMEFQETSSADQGMTMTYSLPNARTLPPSSTAKRCRITTLALSDVDFHSSAAPKLRKAAFLRARFVNPSATTTLLKAAGGVTLDGAFLGTTELPFTSPRGHIVLPLGIDPGLTVSYAEPSAKKSSRAALLSFGSKTDTQLFARGAVIVNAKSTKASFAVYDQVPVSQDERLTVEVVLPEGLVHEGSAASAGTAAKGKAGWGSARATMEKAGLVRWDVTLEKGGACSLPLEYEVKFPSGEHPKEV